MSDNKITHKQGCALAVSWLKRPASRGGPGCQIAFSESRGDWNGETPDAIGLRAGVHDEASVVIEVKISKSDFLADRRKPHRIDPAIGMGKYRYYLAPAGMLLPEDLPPRWGLIEVSKGKSLKVVCGHVLHKGESVSSWQHPCATAKEWTLLVCMLNRVGDVEKAQNYLKEANNRNAYLVRELEKLREANRRLSREQLAAR